MESPLLCGVIDESRGTSIEDRLSGSFTNLGVNIYCFLVAPTCEEVLCQTPGMLRNENINVQSHFGSVAVDGSVYRKKLTHQSSDTHVLTDDSFLPVFFLASAKNTIWLWSTNCWMIQSWLPVSTESGRSWTPCWSRTSIIISRNLRTLKSTPRNSRTLALLTVLKILFEQKPGLPPSLLLWHSTRRCQGIHLLTRKPQTQFQRHHASFIRMQPRWSQFRCSGSPGFHVLHSSILKLWSSSEQAYFLCSCWELVSMLGSRWDVKGVTSSFAFKRITTYHRQKVQFY